MTIARKPFPRGRGPGLSFSCVLLLTLAWPVGVRAAGPVPSGSEFQVNAYTTSAQSFPSVAADSAGNFVVVWDSQSSDGADTSGASIQGQRFDNAGVPLGTQFQINTYTTSAQVAPHVDADGSGNFVVVWTSDRSNGSDSSGYSIQGQRFDHAGAPSGTEFQINTYTTGDQQLPRVVVDGSVKFFVVWESYGSSGSDSHGWSVQGRRFDNTGEPAGSDFQINSYTGGNQWEPTVCAAGSENFVVVVWESYGSRGSDAAGASVQGRRFNSMGVPLGTQFQVNTYTTDEQWQPSVAGDDFGNFVVVWESYGSSGSDSDGWSVQGRQFDKKGLALGTQFQINSYTTSSSFEHNPMIAIDGSRNFIVVWMSQPSSGSDSDGWSVQGQQFHNTGAVLGTEFQINSYTTGDQWLPGVSADGSGNFVVVWVSYDREGYETEIFGRRFASAGADACGDASADGSLSAADALAILRSAVGTSSCLLCVCDVNNDGSITAADALIVLRNAVGQAVTLDCPIEC